MFLMEISYRPVHSFRLVAWVIERLNMLSIQYVRVIWIGCILHERLLKVICFTWLSALDPLSPLVPEALNNPQYHPMLVSATTSDSMQVRLIRYVDRKNNRLVGAHGCAWFTPLKVSHASSTGTSTRDSSSWIEVCPLLYAAFTKHNVYVGFRKIRNRFPLKYQLFEVAEIKSYSE